MTIRAKIATLSDPLRTWGTNTFGQTMREVTAKQMEDTQERLARTYNHPARKFYRALPALFTVGVIAVGIAAIIFLQPIPLVASIIGLTVMFAGAIGIHRAYKNHKQSADLKSYFKATGEKVSKDQEDLQVRGEEKVAETTLEMSAVLRGPVYSSPTSASSTVRSLAWADQDWGTVVHQQSQKHIPVRGVDVQKDMESEGLLSQTPMQKAAETNPRRVLKRPRLHSFRDHNPKWVQGLRGELTARKRPQAAPQEESAPSSPSGSFRAGTVKEAIQVEAPDFTKHNFIASY